MKKSSTFCKSSKTRDTLIQNCEIYPMTMKMFQVLKRIKMASTHNLISVICTILPCYFQRGQETREREGKKGGGGGGNSNRPEEKPVGEGGAHYGRQKLIGGGGARRCLRQFLHISSFFDRSLLSSSLLEINIREENRVRSPTLKMKKEDNQHKSVKGQTI